MRQDLLYVMAKVVTWGLLQSTIFFTWQLIHCKICTQNLHSAGRDWHIHKAHIAEISMDCIFTLKDHKIYHRLAKQNVMYGRSQRRLCSKIVPGWHVKFIKDILQLQFRIQKNQFANSHHKETQVQKNLHTYF